MISSSLFILENSRNRQIVSLSKTKFVKPLLVKGAFMNHLNSFCKLSYLAVDGLFKYPTWILYDHWIFVESQGRSRRKFTPIIHGRLSELLRIEGILLGKKTYSSILQPRAGGGHHLQPADGSCLVETIRVGTVGVSSLCGKSPVHARGVDTDIR